MKMDLNNVCMFCGQPMKEKWDEYTKYHECDCDDSKLNREIDKKINELEMNRPREKYYISKCLRKIGE